MAEHEIPVDSALSLTQQPDVANNRWHPDITHVLSARPGDEVVLETFDAFDGQLGRRRHRKPLLPEEYGRCPNGGDLKVYVHSREAYCV